MRIGGIGTAAVGSTERPRFARRPETHETAPAEARAVIAVAPPAHSERIVTHTRYPAAPFLAHLIATHMHVPQTRERRRAEPQDAVAAYAADAVAPVRGRLARYA
jgi:hypothetical protein